MTSVRRVLSLLPICLVAACAVDRAVAPPSFAISDGARGGNAHFYFLPPMVSPPTYGGVFDASLSPVVRITQGSALVTSLNAASDPLAELYQANWRTGDFALDPTKPYRITVLVGAIELGFADVDLVATGRELRNVNTGDYIPLLDGRTLPIKFRIERGALPSGVGLILFDDGFVPNVGVNRTFRIMNADGSNVRLVASGIGTPDLSPDGQSIVYTRHTSNTIFRANVDGSNETILFSDYYPQYLPRWSWDGSKIVWTREVFWGSDNREIFSMNADGSAVTRLTNNGHFDDGAEWSPDGSQVLFASNPGGWPAQLFTMKADGSAITQITNMADGAIGGRYSPSGTMIAFNVYRPGGVDVYLLDLRAGTPPVLVHSDPCDAGSVSFSPDGLRLGLSACRQEGQMDIYTMKLDGSDVRRLTATPNVNETMWRWR
jgi:hypothetical protein